MKVSLYKINFLELDQELKDLAKEYSKIQEQLKKEKEEFNAFNFDLCKCVNSYLVIASNNFSLLNFKLHLEWFNG